MRKIFIPAITILLLSYSALLHSSEISGSWLVEADSGEVYAFTFVEADRTFYMEGADVWFEGTYEIRTDCHPKQLDLVIKDSYRNDDIGKTSLYIYRYEGETLMLCGNEPGASYRPTSFEGSDETGRYIYISFDYDKSDDDEEDDSKVRLYASCFIRAL